MSKIGIVKNFSDNVEEVADEALLAEEKKERDKLADSLELAHTPTPKEDEEDVGHEHEPEQEKHETGSHSINQA